MGRVIQTDAVKQTIQIRLNERECWVKLADLDSFPAHRVLVPGDWVEVEASWKDFTPDQPHDSDASQWRLLSPNRSGKSPSFTHNHLAVQRMQGWSRFLSAVREFFSERDFLEVTTPIAVRSPGTEVHLEPMHLRIQYDFSDQEHYLITSPEYSLKKWIAQGASQVFEIARCFRNQEAGSAHLAEFFMLEWYRSPGRLEEIAMDVEGLIQRVTSLSDFSTPNHRPHRLVRTSIENLFRDKLGRSISPQSGRVEYISICQSLGVHFDETDSLNDLFHRIWLSQIEPFLNEWFHDQPVCVLGFPPFQAALARVGSDGWAQRFEIYWRGFEVCNAYQELNDPNENERRMKMDLAERDALGKSVFPVDEKLIEALRQGIPPSAGVALGLERLYMASRNERDIHQVWSISSPTSS